MKALPKEHTSGQSADKGLSKHRRGKSGIINARMTTQHKIRYQFAVMYHTVFVCAPGPQVVQSAPAKDGITLFTKPHFRYLQKITLSSRPASKQTPNALYAILPI